MSYILLESKDTYFEVLPPEFNLIIVSKLTSKTLINHTSLLIYQSFRGLLSDNTWRDLFILRYPNEYNFIINVRNVIGKVSWQNMFIFYLNSYLELENTRTLPQIVGYMSDIFNLNMIKFRYPKFYDEIKHINLDSRGAIFGMYFYQEPTVSKWYTVAFWVDKIKEYGIVNGKYDDMCADTFVHPIDVINSMVNNGINSVETKYIVLLLNYIIKKHQDPMKIKLTSLFFVFTTHLDIYNEIISRLDVRQLPDPDSSDYNEVLRRATSSPYGISLFVYDIKSRYKKLSHNI